MNIVDTRMEVRVDDLDASRRFFTTHLGFREVVATGEFVWLSRDDGAADITLQRRPSEEYHQPSVIVSYAVTGLAAEYERLRAEGAPITTPLRRAPWDEWSMRLTDPNGIVIELVEWMAPAGA